ncbi:MAG: pilus assembly protein PilZ [Treponema sp.]|nr:pilus assembly protein PilZ [Treponema sp.]
MSNENENNTQLSINGKKIFFLYPTVPVQNQIITELVQQEYEAYIAKDHTRLMRSLKNYPDSIIYINIDDKMPEVEWEKFILNLSKSFPDVKVGVFSSNSNDDLKLKYINVIKISCGFFSLKVDMSKAVEAVLEILNVLNAKGRRKYLRATAERETNASMNMPFNGEYINSSVRDISVVGLSCVFEHDPGLRKNQLYKDIQIKLQSMLLKVDAVVFGSREEFGQLSYVFLFTQRIDPEVRVKIRKYIQNNLQAKMDNEIN